MYTSVERVRSVPDPTYDPALLRQRYNVRLTDMVLINNYPINS